MLVIKINSFSHCLIHCNSICNSCSCIICMTGPVNFSSLNHHEKSSIIIQNFNTFFHIVRKTPFAIFQIHIIAHRIVISKCLINYNCFSIFCSKIFCLCFCLNHFISSFLSKLI